MIRLTVCLFLVAKASTLDFNSGSNENDVITVLSGGGILGFSRKESNAADIIRDIFSCLNLLFNENKD